MSSITANTTPSLHSIKPCSTKDSDISQKPESQTSPRLISRPLFNRAYTTESTNLGDAPKFSNGGHTIDVVDEIDPIQRVSTATFLSANGGSGSTSSNSKITKSFKNLFVKPSKKNNLDEELNSLTLTDDSLNSNLNMGASVHNSTSTATNSPESSFRSSYNNGSALSTATSIETCDDTVTKLTKESKVTNNNDKRNSQRSTGFCIEREDIDELLSSAEDHDVFDDFDNELAYNKFLQKCAQKSSQSANGKLKSKKSVFNFRRQNTIESEAAEDEENSVTNNSNIEPPQPQAKGLKTIMNVKRKQEEKSRLKKIRSVPTLRIPTNNPPFTVNKNDIKLPISPPAYQTSFRRGSGVNNTASPPAPGRSSFSRPPSASMLANNDAALFLTHRPDPRTSIASHQSYHTTVSRNSVSSQLSQGSQISSVSQLSQYQRPSSLYKKNDTQ